jgi:hypothetical protein
VAWYSIGPSSYPDLFGQTQYVNSKRIADQFLSMKRDFDAMKIAAGSGDRLSPNEGRRTKARCELLWANYVRTGYPVAATLYTSRHYEGTHGNAIDVGVTMANGKNRALTATEFAWMHTQAEKRGFTWTGVNFGEPWHIEGATRPEVYPPYPDIIAGAPATPTPIGPKPAPVIPEDDTVYAIRNSTNGAYFSLAPGFIRYNGDTATADLVRKVSSGTDEVHSLSDADVKRLLGGFGLPTDASDPNWVIAHSNLADRAYSAVVAAVKGK